MLQELQNLIQQFTKDGRYLEAHLDDIMPTIISYSKETLESVQNSQYLAGNIRVFEKGLWAFYSFNNLHWEKVVQQFSIFIKNLEFVPARKGFLATIPPIIFHDKMEIIKNPQNITIEEKSQFLLHYRNLVKEEINPTQIQATYKDVLKKSYYVNSEGTVLTKEHTFIGVGIYSMFKQGAHIQRGGFSLANYGGMDIIEGLESQILEENKLAKDLLTAEPVEKGKHTVILDNQMTGVFAHEAFGHLSEADFISENQNLQQLMKLGAQFGVDDLNIIDDGRLKECGYTPFDDEGVMAQQNYLIKQGRLVGRLHSRETAGSMGERVTGNARALSALYSPMVRMTNTYIDRGKWKKEELFDQIQDGYYCISFIGGMTNLESFTFTPARVYRIKNGQIGSLCRDAMLSGNVFETLYNIQAIGNDLQHFGTLGGCGKGGQNGLPVSIGGPHLLLNNALIG